MFDIHATPDLRIVAVGAASYGQLAEA